MIDTLTTIAFVSLLLACAALDIRIQRMPNVLTVSGLVLALARR